VILAARPQLRFAKVRRLSVIMLAGLQCSVKTTLRASSASCFSQQATAMLVASTSAVAPRRRRQLHVWANGPGGRVYVPAAGNGVGDPVQVARRLDRLCPPPPAHIHVVVIEPRPLAIDEEYMRHAASIRDATDPDEILFVVPR